MRVEFIEDEIHDTLIGIADLAKEYVNGAQPKAAMKKQLRKLDRLWGKLADEFVKGVKDEVHGCDGRCSCRCKG